MDYMIGFEILLKPIIKGALPKDKIRPKNVLHNLYAEQLSGSPFSSPLAITSDHGFIG